MFYKGETYMIIHRLVCTPYISENNILRHCLDTSTELKIDRYYSIFIEQAPDAPDRLMDEPL